MNISPERELMNNSWLPELSLMLEGNSLIYDIGVGAYDYTSLFPKCQIETIDYDKRKCADNIWDVENEEDLVFSDKADGVICIGVTEQCNNPFILVKNISEYLVKYKGKVFFSVLLTGYPLYETDFCRFTHDGALRLLNRYFNPIRFCDSYRGDIPSCLFYIGENK
jgi:hypothetical protein